MPDSTQPAARPEDLIGLLVDEMADDLGAAPDVRDVLAVIGASFPSNPSLFKGYRYPVTFQVDGAPLEPRPRLDDLGDAPFALASDLVGLVAVQQAAELRRPITYAEFSRYLLGLLAAIPGGPITSLAVAKTRAVRRLADGDLVAVPAEGGGVHIGIALVHNRFGTAVGFWAGTFASPRMAAVRSAEVAPFPPLYTDDDAIAADTWRVIGHDESLRSRFPARPEIYHRPNTRFPQLGAFGGAETPEGVLRAVSAAEAAAVGLADGSYVQHRSSSQVRRFLDERAAAG